MIFVPIGFALVAALFHRDLHVGVGAVAKVVLGRALLPLLLGLGAARLSPRLAAKAGPVLNKILIAVLLAVVVLALVATWKRLADVGGVGWLRRPGGRRRGGDHRSPAGRSRSGVARRGRRGQRHALPGAGAGAGRRASRRGSG